MHKFLRISIITLLLPILFITLNVKVYASNCDFYESILTNWEYAISHSNSEGCIETSDYEIIKTKNNFSLKIYSDINEFKKLNLDKIFISANIPNTQDKAFIFIEKNQNSTQIIIPVEYLTDYKFSNILKDYIASYADSNKKLKQDELQQDQFNKINQNKFLIEITGYAIAIFIFVAFFYRIIKLLIDHPSKANEIKLLIKSKIYAVYHNFDKLKPFIVILAFVAFLSLIRIASLIAYKDKNTVDIGYVVSLILQLESNSFIRSSIENRSETNLVLIINFQILILLVGLISIPYVFRFLIETSKFIKQRRIKASFAKYLFLILSFIALALTILDTSVSFTYYIAIICILVGIIAIFRTSPKLLTFNKSQKIFVLVIAIIIFMIVFTLKYYNKNRIQLIEFKLFNEDSKLVVNPIIYDLDDSSKFTFVQKHDINQRTPIFLNDYLIYHPNFKKIVNTDIKGINLNEDNFYITVRNKTGSTIVKLISDENYSNIIKSDKPTKTIILKSSENNVESIIVNIVENCLKPIDPYVVELNQIDFKDGNLEYSFTDKILNSKGCNDLDYSQNIYQYKLILPANSKRIYTIPNNTDIYIELPDLDGTQIFESYISDDIYKPTIFIQNDNDTSTIYNVIPGKDKDIESVTIEENNNPQRINITVQNLYDKGILGTKLEFWTPDLSPLIDRLD